MTDIPYTFSEASTSDVAAGLDAYIQWGDQFLVVEAKQGYQIRNHEGTISNAANLVSSPWWIENRVAWSNQIVNINLAHSLKGLPNFPWTSSLSDLNLTWSPSTQ
jgi:hypothetical protein